MPAPTVDGLCTNGGTSRLRPCMSIGCVSCARGKGAQVTERVRVLACTVICKRSTAPVGSLGGRAGTVSKRLEHGSLNERQRCF